MIRKCLAAWLSSMFLLTASARAADEAAGDPGVAFKQKAAERPIARARRFPFSTVCSPDCRPKRVEHGQRREPRAVKPTAIARVAANPGAMWALKVGATRRPSMRPRRSGRHRRAEAIATMVAVNGMMVVVATRNASVMHGLK